MTVNSKLLTLEQKIGQLFFIGISGPEIDAPTKDLLTEVAPGGVCLFSRNIKEALQTRKLLDGIRAISQITPFLSIDQEGGLVDRLRRIMPPVPAASKLQTVEDAVRLGEIIAETLSLLGFNMDFAPVVDVIDANRSRHTNGLFSRTFGATKEDVAEFAGEILDTLQKNAIIGCLKHFPGLGAARVDSHEDLPAVEISEGELNEIDLFPYRELMRTKNVKVIMAAHASFPGHRLQETDRNGKLLPSSLSYGFITTLLREELQFNGVVITDDLEMGAIEKHYGVSEACNMALTAGADMLAICAEPKTVREGFYSVLQAVKDGHLSIDRLDTSVERILSLKADLAQEKPFDSIRLTHLSQEITALNARLNG